ncbi:MAG: hypothetical protein EAX96_01990 [Candidatus Lokiarchaeota archaeon]|nr:hypothetical protein [Candidatus Lokiarchaeota archaeon]
MNVEILTFKDERKGNKLNIIFNLSLFIYFTINLIIFGIFGDAAYLYNLHGQLFFHFLTFFGFSYFLIRLSNKINSSKYYSIFSLSFLFIFNFMIYFILPSLSIYTFQAYMYYITEAYPWIEEIQRFINLIIIFDVLNSLKYEKIKNLSRFKKLLISYIITLLIFILGHYKSVNLSLRFFDMFISSFFIFLFIILTENYYLNVLTHVFWNKIQFFYPTSSYLFLFNLNEVPVFYWIKYFYLILFLIIVFISSLVIYEIRKENKNGEGLINKFQRSDRNVSAILIILYIINTISFFILAPYFSILS